MTHIMQVSKKVPSEEGRYVCHAIELGADRVHTIIRQAWLYCRREFCSNRRNHDTCLLHLSWVAAMLADIVESPGQRLRQLINHLRCESIWVQAVLYDTGQDACLG